MAVKNLKGCGEHKNEWLISEMSLFSMRPTQAAPIDSPTPTLNLSIKNVHTQVVSSQQKLNDKTIRQSEVNKM